MVFAWRGVLGTWMVVTLSENLCTTIFGWDDSSDEMNQELRHKDTRFLPPQDMFVKIKH